MHQPVDNFGDAVEEAITKCYAPFFATMAKYPQFKFSVHCSGWLLDQIRTKHPKIFAHIQRLTDAGAIEWIGAGYYEPVLSAIPSKDRRAQIKELSNYLQKHLKAKPQGLWLTERVWESALIPDLCASDIDFVVVDDYHFLSSGFKSTQMDGYFNTEEGGEELSLFPISQALRYALPFFSVERAIDAILHVSHKEEGAAIIFDDAEKFGLWPQTHEWCYEKQWLERFIEAVLEHTQITTEHYGDYRARHRSKGIAYLNNTSYFEMGEWSLRAEQTLALEHLKEEVGLEYFEQMGVAFIKGGIWKNFLVKYTESNYLHKRMLGMSKIQNELSMQALENLYKLQTNDVFWHGVFGGLYLPNLRDNAYSYLLQIEKERAGTAVSYETGDIDMDGYEELKALSPKLSVVFSAKHGAQMVELGSLERFFNWQNTLMRRKEAYHEKILNPKPVVQHDKTPKNSDEIATIHNAEEGADEDLKAELIYDWHHKYSFVDHFATQPFSLDVFKTNAFNEVGDFANQPFELDAATHCFMRQGGIYLDTSYPAGLSKCYDVEAEAVTLKLDFNTAYEDPLYYAMEFNFHVAHPDHATLNGHLLGEGLTLSSDTLEIVDSFTQKCLKLTCNRKCTIEAYILNTVSQSESGFDKVAQQISLIFWMRFESKAQLNMCVEVNDV